VLTAEEEELERDEATVGEATVAVIDDVTIQVFAFWGCYVGFLLGRSVRPSVFGANHLRFSIFTSPPWAITAAKRPYWRDMLGSLHDKGVWAPLAMMMAPWRTLRARHTMGRSNFDLTRGSSH